MPLLGKAAMLLTFDVEQDAISEHDDWHTHEHLPERLSIPGFLRGTRWVAVRGAPRYAVLYEVDRLETLGSRNYLERLNNPSPWTSKMMTCYRAMSRGPQGEPSGEDQEEAKACHHRVRRLYQPVKRVMVLLNHSSIFNRINSNSFCFCQMDCEAVFRIA